MYLAEIFVLYGVELSFSDAAAPSWRTVMTREIAEADECLEEHNAGGNIW